MALDKLDLQDGDRQTENILKMLLIMLILKLLLKTIMRLK